MKYDPWSLITAVVFLPLLCSALSAGAAADRHSCALPPLRALHPAAPHRSQLVGLGVQLLPALLPGPGAGDRVGVMGRGGQGKESIWRSVEEYGRGFLHCPHISIFTFSLLFSVVLF